MYQQKPLHPIWIPTRIWKKPELFQKTFYVAAFMAMAYICSCKSILHADSPTPLLEPVEICIFPVCFFLLKFIRKTIIFLGYLSQLKTRFNGDLYYLLKVSYERLDVGVTIGLEAIVLFICYCLHGTSFLEFMKDMEFQNFFLPIFCLCFFFACLEIAIGYNDVTVSTVMKKAPCMPQLWANSCYSSYYIKVLADIKERMAGFEDNHSISFPLKKLVIVIPLSCDVRGTFDTSHANIDYVEDLTPIENDQGANMNRRYKNPVYKIVSPDGKAIHVAMEQPSSLLMFWKMRKDMKPNHLRYQRDLFISTLRDYLKDEPCEIIIYDDTKKSELVPLSTFLLAEINKLVKQEEDQTGIVMKDNLS